MSQQFIDIGSSAGAGDGDDLRVAFDKVNQNFTEIYGGNVSAANVLVYSVAGRQGNVELSWQDIAGVATVGNITSVLQTISAANLALQNYADNAVANLGPISNIEVTGGTLTNVHINGHSWGNVANLTVTGGQTIDGQLTIGSSLSVGQNLVVVGDTNVQTVFFDDGSFMSTAPNLTPVNNSIAAANAKITAANAAILSVQGNVDAANLAITELSSGQTAANSVISTLTANASTQSVQIAGLTSGQTAANLQTNIRFAVANLELGNLRANITAANATISSNYTTLDARISNESLNIIALTSNAAIQANLITALQANIAAANVVIGSISIGSIDDVNANVTAANAAIATLQSNAAAQATVLDTLVANAATQATTLNTLSTNAATQATTLNTLTANALAQGILISTLASNASAQSVEIAELRANVTAANSAIASFQSADFATNASVQAANTSIQINTNRINAANAQILLRANIASPNFTGTVTTPALAVTGNATTGNISATTGVFGNIAGTVVTAAQPYITSLGNLTVLNVDGDAVVDQITAARIYGTIQTPAQTNITEVGTLVDLDVTGNVTVGNISGTKGTFTNLQGTLVTAGQTNITQVGTLDGLDVTGNITGGASIALTGNVHTSRVFASNLTGRVATGLQPNITTVGTLTGLTVSGNATAANLNTTGTVSAVGLSGTLQTSAQPNINTVGNLTSLNVDGIALIAGNVAIGGNVQIGGRLGVSSFSAALVTAGSVSGNLLTNAQPFITSVGTLTGLNSSGNIRAANLIANSNVIGNFIGNIQGFQGTFEANLNAGNISAVRLYGTGNVDVGNNINLVGNLVSGPASIISTYWVQSELVSGTIRTALQPNITQVGTLTGLTVNGPVEITGSQFVAQDFYVTGNLFVNGNTTTVSAGNVTTSDKDLTLANGAVSSTAARGAGIYIGTGGVYGNISVYDGTWATAQNVDIGGNLTAGNVGATKGAFSLVSGFVETATQPNITSVGTLTSVTTTGAVTAANITVAGATIQDINATNANLGVVRTSSHVFASGNVLGVVGEFTGLSGSLRTALQPNITQVGTLGTLSVTGNVTTGNISGTTGDFTSVSGTIVSASQPNITTVGNLTALIVNGTATVGGLVIAGGGAGSEFSVANVTATSQLTTSNLTVTGNANLVSFTGTVLTNVQPYITSIGALSVLDVTGATSLANITANGATVKDLNTTHANIGATAFVVGNVTTGNVSGTTGTFTNVRGVILDSVQTNITSIGTLDVLAVTGNVGTGNVSGATGSFTNVVTNQLHSPTGNFTGNVSTGNVSGATGTFTNVRGTIIDATQTNITKVGTLIDLDVTGNIGATANVSAGNVNATNLYGSIKTASQPLITEIGTLGNLTVTGTISGNITATFLTGTIVNAFQPNITTVGNLLGLNVQGNIDSLFGSMNAASAKFGAVDATILTNAQPYITSVGTLSVLDVTGNVSSANLVTGNINSSGILNIAGNVTTSANVNAVNVYASGALVAPVSNIAGNVTAGNLVTTGEVNTSNLRVSGTSALVGNVTVANISVSQSPTILGANIFAGTSNLSISTIVSSGTITAPNLRVTSGEVSTSAVTGALVVSGGLGLAGNLWMQGLIIAGDDIITEGNLNVQSSSYFGDDIYLNSAAVSIGLLSNVANVAIFPSTTTRIEIGGEATTVNIGAVSGFGNTTVRNDLTVNGGLFLTGGWGEYGIGNVIINHDLGVANTVYANNISLSNNISAFGNVNINGAVTATGVYPSSLGGTLSVGGLLGVGGNITAAGNLVTNGGGNNTISGNLALSGTARSTSVTTGSFTTRGGAGILGNLVVGAPLNSNSNVYINSVTPTIVAGTGALQVAGGMYTGGNLWVDGDATIVGNVNFTAFVAASINGTPIGNATPSTGAFSVLAISQKPPAKRPVFRYDFANYPRLDQSLRLTRSGPGTYFNEKGKLAVAAAGAARFTYDPETLLSRGILIEESRQNLYRESSSFSNAAVYSTLDVTISSVAHATDSPSGEFDAWKIIEGSSTGTHGVFQSPSYVPTVTQTQLYTASVFVKAGERDQVALVFFNEGTPSVFDLTAGTVDAEGAAYNSTITPVGNAWYRIQSTVTKTNTSGNVMIAPSVGGTINYAGDGTSGFYAYGLQIEPGSFATSYIPNTTIANTRTADVLTIVSHEFDKRYDAYSSTVVVDAALDYRPTTQVPNNFRSTLVSFNDGTASNRISVLAENKNGPVDRTANLVIYSAGSLVSNINIATANLTTTGSEKVAMYFSGIGAIGTAFSGNGNVTTITAFTSTAMDQITIGSGPGTGSLNGTIGKLAIYSGVVTGQELKTLTLK